MYKGDVESLSQVMPMMASEFERVPPADKTNSLVMLKGMASTIESIDIVDRKFDSPDEARLTVQITHREGMNLNAAFDSTFILRRTNNNGQIIGEARPAP